MYKQFLLSEIKKWLRDPMMKFMLAYPIVLALIGRYVLPELFIVSQYADLVIVTLTLLTPTLFGALLAFSILDDRDDSILTSIKVTPLSVHQFLSFRMIMATFMCFIASLATILFINIGNLYTNQLSFFQILSISFLISLSTPSSALLINALAKNKRLQGRGFPYDPRNRNHSSNSNNISILG